MTKRDAGSVAIAMAVAVGVTLIPITSSAQSDPSTTGKFGSVGPGGPGKGGKGGGKGKESPKLGPAPRTPDGKAELRSLVSRKLWQHGRALPVAAMGSGSIESTQG